MPQRVKDKVVIVVGAGSIGPGWGNGKAAAVLYAREGAQVVAADLNLSAAQETQALIVAAGNECIAVQTDVTDAAAVEAMVNCCLETYGRVDILHNNVFLTQ